MKRVPVIPLMIGKAFQTPLEGFLYINERMVPDPPAQNHSFVRGSKVFIYNNENKKEEGINMIECLNVLSLYPFLLPFTSLPGG